MLLRQWRARRGRETASPPFCHFCHACNRADSYCNGQPRSRRGHAIDELPRCTLLTALSSLRCAYHLPSHLQRTSRAARAELFPIFGHETALWHATRPFSTREGARVREKPRSADPVRAESASERRRANPFCARTRFAGQKLRIFAHAKLPICWFLHRKGSICC